MGGGDRDRGGDRGDRRNSGPHFPTSRLMGETPQRDNRSGPRNGGRGRFDR
jgi:hypothetical protein